tara:strand:+ start:367 stop:747 length:381 start_codon:yes stop_codon:yes gene_type:complete
MEKKYADHLTEEEKRVIVDGGTELPFSGKYNDFYLNGFYACKSCGFKLFESVSKFKSDCGWPSFDDAIEGRVIKKRDTSLGRVRTEVLCSHCGGHLGHVFKGEGYTDKNTRYCVNSISLKFIEDKL